MKPGLHCQETNQTFVPFSRRSQKKQLADNEGGLDGDHQGQEEEEDMSDLLPEMFDLIGSDIENDDDDEDIAEHKDIAHKNGDPEDSFEEVDDDMMEFDEDVKQNGDSKPKRKLDPKVTHP